MNILINHKIPGTARSKESIPALFKFPYCNNRAIIRKKTIQNLKKHFGSDVVDKYLNQNSTYMTKQRTNSTPEAEKPKADVKPEANKTVEQPSLQDILGAVPLSDIISAPVQYHPHKWETLGQEALPALVYNHDPEGKTTLIVFQVDAAGTVRVFTRQCYFVADENRQEVEPYWTVAGMDNAD